MDQVTAAIVAGDADALGRLHTEDAVADTPDEGRLVGGVQLGLVDPASLGPQPTEAAR